MALCGPAGGDAFRDELDRCNSDNGEEAFKQCLAAASTREADRARDRQLLRKKETEAKAARTDKIRAAHHARSRDTAAKRASIAREYERLLHKLFPEHNFLRIATEDAGNGFRLLGTHPLFSRYTLSVGPAGRMIQDWVRANRATLNEAYIHAVGVQSDTGDSVAFKLP